jgi:hypothetical protein
MQLVLCMTLTEDDDVIDITPGKCPHTSQNLVHDLLEEHWGVLQSKRHHDPLIQAVRAPERSLRNIFLCYADLMKPSKQVECCINSRILYVPKDILKRGQNVTVGH